MAQEDVTSAKTTFSYSKPTRPALNAQSSSDSSINTLSSVSSAATFSSISSSSSPPLLTNLDNPYARLSAVPHSPVPRVPLPSPSFFDESIYAGSAISPGSSRTSSFNSARPDSGSFLESVSETEDGLTLEPLSIDGSSNDSLAYSIPSPSSTMSYPPFASTSTFPPSSSMSRSRSVGQRPSSADTSSSSGSGSGSGNSGRPWVRDSDCSSACSSLMSGDGDGSGEVYRVIGGDDMEFLDPRPEPPGANLTISRDDPTQIVLKVTLPGFSIENITVAMRRGHKVHIVADKYSKDEGGHFEKLVSLGSEITSAAPRAEFNGTELRVYVQRRHPRSAAPIVTSASATSPSTSASSPTGVVTSPNLSAPMMGVKTTCGAGPEAAKAAAKKAKEEAARRAKEEARFLPKVGRKITFRWGSPACMPRAASPVDGTRADTSSPENGSSRSASGSSSPNSIGRNGLDAPTPVANTPVPSSPTKARPPLRSSDLNLTLRANDGESFLQAATAAAASYSAEARMPLDTTGSVTPKGESPGFAFSMSSPSAAEAFKL